MEKTANNNSMQDTADEASLEYSELQVKKLLNNFITKSSMI